jgi:hypothetical protein
MPTRGLGRALYLATGRVRYDLRRGVILNAWDKHGKMLYQQD